MISALFKHGYQSRATVAGYRADTSPFAVDGSHIKWAWLRALAVTVQSFFCAEMRQKANLA
jgi:hypothetical protein